MEDRESWFTLRLKGEHADVPQEWLDRCAQAVHHALEVAFREEYELAMAEMREAMNDGILFGSLVDTDAIVARFAERIERLSEHKG